MRRLRFVSAAALLSCAAGCTQEPLWLVENGPTGGGSGASASAPAPVQPDLPTVVSSTQAQMLNGTVTGRGQYQLFDIGPSSAGDEWTASWGGTPFSASPFILTLFDANDELLSRSIVASGGELRHIMRTDSARLQIGVSPASGSNGGKFTFSVRRRTGMAIPGPQAQVAWISFEGGQDVRVHGRDGIDFAPFTGSMLGSAYASKTQIIKDAIIAEMRSHYAAYNVEILSSDEGPPPSGPHTVLHFGGNDASLLGLADNIDLYNSNVSQTAVIYVDAFAAYATMRLEPEEFAVMIANVASHELGHLLGLYHTKNPDDVMDTTGSAWELAGEQWFGTAELEPSVFPTGRENSPLRLSEGVGMRPVALVAAEPETGPAPKSATLKPQIRALLRQFTDIELQHACGTCLDIDVCGEPHN